MTTRPNIGLQRTSASPLKPVRQAARGACPALRPRRCYNDAVYLEHTEDHGPVVEIAAAVGLVPGLMGPHHEPPLGCCSTPESMSVRAALQSGGLDEYPCCDGPGPSLRLWPWA
jgi:hypothetical protein